MIRFQKAPSLAITKAIQIGIVANIISTHSLCQNVGASSRRAGDFVKAYTFGAAIVQQYNRGHIPVATKVLG